MLFPFNDEQLEFVYTVLDPKHWAMKFKKKQADVEVVKEVAKELKIMKTVICDIDGTIDLEYVKGGHYDPYIKTLRYCPGVKEKFAGMGSKRL